MVNREEIERDRDQIWAEAVVRFKAGSLWWLETPELEALATAEQEARFRTDPWKEPVETWIGTRLDTSLAEVLEHALGIPPKNQSHSAVMRVAKILADLGFTKRRTGPRSTRSHRYQREKILKNNPLCAGAGRPPGGVWRGVWRAPAYDAYDTKE
jgi:predicted P-loop ATPase